MKLVIVLLLWINAVFAKQDYCKKITIIKRENIYANAKSLNQIKTPAGRVFWTQTGGANCNFHTCKSAAILHRWTDMDNGFADIRDNFLIGSDGIVYEGLGWQAKNLRYNQYANDVSIAFIGEFNKILPEPLSDVAKNLIQCGVQKGHIDPYFGVYSIKGENEGIDKRLQDATFMTKDGGALTCHAG